jgi:hypothetical protein
MVVRNIATMLKPNNDENTIEAIQCTCGCEVHAKANKPTGRITPAMQQSGRRSSGARGTPPPAMSFRT